MSNKSYDFIMNIISKNKITLSNLEKNIIENLKNSDIDISDIDINTFAKEFFISNSTITRFSQKLGFNGFTELKYALHNDESRFKYITQDRYSTFINDIEPLNDEITTFIKNLDKFQKIVIIGIGSSGLVANEFIYKMGELGLYNTDYAKEPYKIDMIAKSLNQNDLMICLSLSGENDNILKAARVAKQVGSVILSISGSENSTLKTYSDYYIKVPNYSIHEYSISKIFPILSIVDIICEIYSKK